MLKHTQSPTCANPAPSAELAEALKEWRIALGLALRALAREAAGFTPDAAAEPEFVRFLRKPDSAIARLTLNS